VPFEIFIGIDMWVIQPFIRVGPSGNSLNRRTEALENLVRIWFGGGIRTEALFEVIHRVVVARIIVIQGVISLQSVFSTWFVSNL
jgi:hypothetical protein